MLENGFVSLTPREERGAVDEVQSTMANGSLKHAYMVKPP